MATRKTYTFEVTCDVCKKKEILNEGDPQSIFSVESAVRETGFLNERGQLIKSKEQPLLIEKLDLCIDCREKSYTMIIARITQPYTTDVVYSFLRNKEQEEK